MNIFKRFAVLSLVFTYLVIFIGGLVRVSGAGLGCPDWPKCFGRWIPPTDVSQLPAHMDPAMFNFTLAWIEYINRLFGVALGLIILTTAILAIIHMRKQPKVLYSSILATLLVAFQGWQGSRVVSSALEPFIISIHLFIALMIVSVLIYMVYHTYQEKTCPDRDKKPYLFYLFFGYYLLMMIQIIMGTQIRSSLEIIRELYPLQMEIEWILKVGPVQTLHTWLGIGMSIGGVFLTVYTIINDFLKKEWQKRVLAGFTITLIVELILGFVLIWVGIPPAIQLLHLWTASIGMGLILALTVDQAQIK